ncbi:UMP kinase [Candidatus Microgenomates bacterium]|nr:UMP kinase [Candidatus Microgenomates bacterium]
MSYQRVLLKLSGEQFAGTREQGIDAEFLADLVDEIKDVISSTKTEMAIVVGGGNFMRGAAVAKHGVDRVTGDYMGMLATILNGMALVDMLEQKGLAGRLLTRVRVESVAEPYIRRRGVRHLEKGRVVVVAGGTGNPYVTTDTAAIVTALELGCEVVMKATKVDGVYDKDPAKHKDAVKYDKLGYDEAIQSEHINVMDDAAVSLAKENHLPIVVFGLLTKGNIKKVIQGQAIGTHVSHHTK